MSKDTENKPTVQAELVIKSPEGQETIRTFDKAFHRALELPTPVNIKFNRWVRIEK